MRWIGRWRGRGEGEGYTVNDQNMVSFKPAPNLSFINTYCYSQVC